MRIPEKWLRHYCNPPVDGAALEHLLTMGGMEVESREPVAAVFSGVVVARIVSAAKHPDADRLQVCMVDVGQAEPVQIVCGAPNARAGLVTACALPGAVLPGDFRIKKTKMRGQALDLDEDVLELKLTPNLAHCMSVLGVARDLGALANHPVQEPAFAPVAVTSDAVLPVRIEEPALCGRFAGRVIRGVNASAPSPDWVVPRTSSIWHA